MGRLPTNSACGVDYMLILKKIPPYRAVGGLETHPTAFLFDVGFFRSFTI
ncbi:MAG: hypothetical protein IKI11_05910 [Neisseriaceae bacterium]|nr:hypothetical protein [Neisseriaceae bacterium]